MSPPLPVTEDTPPDMLAGAMDLHVVLPNGQDMKMSVERSTPMMDLLVQVTTANKISPGGHVIQAVGDRGILPYKPSTPIGALDTWTIHIVPKKKVGMILKKPFTKPVSNTPFEQTFRLQINLPRNQLYVSRVSYKTRLEDVLSEVCKEKNLDQSKYCFTHPDKLDEELDLSKTFLDHKLQQVTLVSKTNRPVGLSSVDVIALKRYDSRNQHVNNKYYASHSYDGSVSSGSMEGRSLSPVRSDESSSSPTIPKTNSILNRPFRKRRPAPKPPSLQNGQDTKHVPDSLTISHSRNSSDSSGYHESSVLSESPESNSNSLADLLPRRSKLTENRNNAKVSQPVPNSSGKIGGNLSRSLSNLVAAVDGKSRIFLSNGMRHKEYSASSMSLASIPGRKKKAPAPPPPSSKSLLSLKEEEIPNGHVTISQEILLKSQTLPATNKLTTFSVAETNCSKTTSPDPEPTHPVDSRTKTPPVDAIDSTASAPLTDVAKPDNSVKDKELTMDDEEIDRIFHDATKDYESPSLPVLPSPPKLLSGNDEDKCSTNGEDPYNWEYKLPSPPKAFRDQSSSPSVTEYDTVTIGNLTDVIADKRLPSSNDKANVMLNNYKNTLYNQELKPSQNAAHTPAMRKPKPDPQIIPTVVEKPKSFYEDPKLKGEKSTNESFGNCDKTPYIDVNYMSTNDSGLGSDESIPSVSEGRHSMEEPSYKKETKAPERRGSTLQNFTITTYQNSKPMEIFHDDSVKTSKTTQIAKNNHPYVKLPFEKNDKINALSRHSSFSTEKTPNSAIKRSKSHISLLSGNFAKFNRFGKLNVKEDDISGNTSPMYSSSENLQMAENPPKMQSVITPKLRKTLSEMSINKGDSNRGGEELLELQDQVMKWKENEKRSCTLNNMRNVSELQSLQVLKDILPQINKPQFQETQIIDSKSTLEDNYPSRARCFKVDVKSKSTVENGPAVNLQSWNDRPKRQVSIKTDRDYVFGNIRRQSEVFENQCRTNDPKPDPASKSTTDKDISRLPIVRAVEFKKPFVQQAILEKTHFSVEVSVPEKPKERESKPRPASCYLFGEHLANGVSRSQSMLIKNNEDKLNGNHIDGCEENEVTCNRVSKTKIMFNSSFPYNNKYKSVTEINEDTSKRHSYHNGNTVEPCTKLNEYTFRNYKNKLIESEKLNGNCDPKPKPLNEKSQKSPKTERSPEKKSFLKMFRKEDPPAEVVTTRSVGVPPPPPVMPTLKPVMQKITSQKHTSDNPRDVLLSSIKNFNRDNLRNVRVK